MLWFGHSLLSLILFVTVDVTFSIRDDSVMVRAIVYMILFVTRDDVAFSILNDSVMVRAFLYLILFVAYYIAFPIHVCQLWFRRLLIVDMICVVWRRHHDLCLQSSAVLFF